MEAKLKTLEAASVPGPTEARDATLRRLQNNMYSAKEAETYAPANYANAERDYHTVKGDYKDTLTAQYEREAMDLKTAMDEKHGTDMMALHAACKSYATTLRYAQNMDSTVNSTLDDLIKVAAQKSAYENAHHTNNRKAFYLDQDFTGLHLWSERLNAVFYALALVLLLQKRWGFGVGVAVIPALLPKAVAYFRT